ncbi:MAG: NAD(P)-binding domain-containing protein [Actinomycetes bacterium]
MKTQVETLIVGAGQAGLALSRCLRDLGRDHVVLERGRVGERWRSERWDSFRLLSPNWQTRLPGFRYRGADPHGFMGRDEIARFLQAYADSFDAPVLDGVTVRSARPSSSGQGWTVHTDEATYEAGNLVVATGHYQRPHVPDMATALPGRVRQLHTWRYRNPGQIAPGGVLVVGAGPSGQQIADELARAGRRVYLAVGHHRPLPRRYRGHDAYWWLDHMGELERNVDTLPGAAPARRPSVVTAGGSEDLDLRRLVRHGVTPVGRLVGLDSSVDSSVARFACDLPDRLAEADNYTARFRNRVDEYVARTGLPAGPALVRVPPQGAPAWTRTAPTRLDLDAAGVRTVIWATGYARDYRWLDAAPLDSEGEPVHRRGVSPQPGLYWMGLRWQWTRSSNSIDGVGRDAAYLAEHLAQRTAVAENVA